MKSLIGFFIFLQIGFLSTASSSESLNWTDLEVGQKYELNFDIQLSDFLVISKGYGFIFEQSMSGGAFVYLRFLNLQCSDPTIETELILFNPEPEDTVNDKSIGLSHEDECKLAVYVETQFIADRSLFLRSE